jgi:hypothetical protein
MRIRAALLLGAALLAPAVPADAATTRPCPPGYHGVIVTDASGDLVTACVRTGEVVQHVGETVAAARDYANALGRWARESRPECWWTEHGIYCNQMDPPPPPRG